MHLRFNVISHNAPIPIGVYACNNIIENDARDGFGLLMPRQ